MIFSEVVIAVHAIAGSLVVLLAPVNLLRRRKDAAHRLLGRSWVLMMYLVCVSGMFIYSLSGGFTIFHALAIFTFVTTTLGVLAIRRGDIRSHIGNMVGSWLGALGAGIFAAVGPGRVLPTLAVHDPLLLWSIVGLVVLAATLWVTWVLWRIPTGRPGAVKPPRSGRPAPARVP